MENQNKQNYSIKIDMLKLNGAFMRNMTGRTATKKCIIIPVDDNPSVYLGEKGCFSVCQLLTLQGHSMATHTWSSLTFPRKSVSR